MLNGRCCFKPCEGCHVLPQVVFTTELKNLLTTLDTAQLEHQLEGLEDSPSPSLSMPPRCTQNPVGDELGQRTRLL